MELPQDISKYDSKVLYRCQIVLGLSAPLPVCDYIEAHSLQYKAFVDDPLLEPDEAFIQHIESMRVSGTYGSHLEISACSRMLQRQVKVIQPGMIYVVNDEDESPSAAVKAKHRMFAKAPESSDEDEHDDVDPALYLM